MADLAGDVGDGFFAAFGEGVEYGEPSRLEVNLVEIVYTGGLFGDRVTQAAEATTQGHFTCFFVEVHLS